ncbi:hypothetical protein HY416_00690 [Candidatus Kaiserbacteria bacterium]|nr:hypothetical protein [Candidatus Kaiserbacteria bacterium]
MKNKSIFVEQFGKIIRQDEEIIFSDTSPVPAIKTPPTAVFVARHGVVPALGISSICGTMYICRTDSSDSVAFNFDVYSFQAGDSSVLQIRHVDNTSIDYHWTDDPPAFLMAVAPQTIRDRIDTIKIDLSKKKTRATAN